MARPLLHAGPERGGAPDPRAPLLARPGAVVGTLRSVAAHDAAVAPDLAVDRRPVSVQATGDLIEAQTHLRKSRVAARSVERPVAVVLSHGDTRYSRCRRFVREPTKSVTKTGLPFDVRLDVRRNGRVEWQTVGVYPRIGSGRTITSNMSTGGSVGDLRKFLSDRFGEQAGAIRRKLMKLASEMPPSFQKL